MTKSSSTPAHWSKTTVGALIAAIGSSLTTATALLSHDSPIWIISMILLAGVTTLGVGLGIHVTPGKEKSHYE